MLYLSRATMRALEAVPKRGARVFNISDRHLCRRIQNACRDAGLGAGYSGHSPRVGMAQDLARDGCELPALMQAGRWQSSAMPARYVRGELAGRGAVARLYAQD